jgi:hypothetical protein
MMTKKKNLLAIMLASMLAIFVFGAAGVFADTDISSGTAAWADGKYVAKGNVTISEPVVVSGDVTLVLENGCELTCSQGIQVPKGASLTIKGEGKLMATGKDNAAGIGGADDGTDKANGVNGKITIEGGTITAQGGKYGAGIGGANDVNGDITINGGTITAAGGENAAGIGGGNVAVPKNGNNDFTNHPDSDTKYDIGDAITINGGDITATGGTGGGAGIGGGYQNCPSSIKIEKTRKVTATGTYGAGIGGGCYADGKEITIRNAGTLTANVTGDGAGIGGGKMGTFGNITIESTDVDSNGGGGSAGIGSSSFATKNARTTVAYGGDITITGGTLDSTGGNHGGAGIGAGYLSDCKNITLDGVTIKEIKGGSAGAGIGGGFRNTYISRGKNDNCANITINNCKMSSDHNPSEYAITGGESAAGIGGGYLCLTGDIRISGSSLSVKGGTCSAGIGGGSLAGVGKAPNNGKITIIGSENGKSGEIKAVGEGGAGIGGGYNNSYSEIDISNLNTVTATGAEYSAGIGGGPFKSGGDISITNCGEVTATGNLYGAGIGGGHGAVTGNIKLSDIDIVKATGGSCAAGIGGGKVATSEISGYAVGSITITNSEIDAEGTNEGAGIGGGGGGECKGITINCKDKNIKAVSTGNGAGIGGGAAGGCGIVNINNGTVYAKSSSGGAGIGNGANHPIISGHDTSSETCEINIMDGTITAIGASGAAGIGSGAKGGGDDFYGSITISGGTIYAYGNGYDGDSQSYKHDYSDPNNNNSGAGIGGGSCQEGWTTTITGGTVNAYGGSYSAGIGGGQNKSSGKIVIGEAAEGKEPVVNAYGGFSAAGIGTGAYVNSTKIAGNDEELPQLRCSITINSGTVKAVGGNQGAGIGGGSVSAVKNITINGGDITAVGRAQYYKDNYGESYVSGAGIGTGPYWKYTDSEGSTIKITGGTIKAYGGKFEDKDEYHQACGIGGGTGNAVSSIQISGGDITAVGGDQSAGIGAGCWFDQNGTYNTEISITAPEKDNVPKVKATGGSSAAGIGSGQGSRVSDIYISGGDVKATGGDYGAGIGTGRLFKGNCGQIVVRGGTVQAFAGEGIGYNKKRADAIGKGADNAENSGNDNSGSFSFSTGKNGCAVIVAKSITGVTDGSTSGLSGIYVPDKETRGQIWSHSVDVTTPEYLPAGYNVDVIYKDDKDDDHVTFSVGREYFRNYGTFYVYGTYYNLNENDLTNVDNGKVIYMIESIDVTDADRMKYKAGDNLSLDGMQVNVKFKDDKGETGNIAWNSPVLKGFTENPADGQTLHSSDNGRHIAVSFPTHEETFTGQTPSGLEITSDAVPADSFTVRYKANGGAGEMISQTAKRGESVTISKNQFTRLGYEFAGWNTMADGTGTSYQPGSKLKADSDVTLYAQWVKSSPTITKKPFMVLKAQPRGSHTEKLTWTRVKGADGYDLYYAKCSRKLKWMKTFKSWKTRTYYKEGLKKGVAYKYKIKAYKMVNGRKKYVCSAIAAHAVAGGYNKKYTDAASIKAAKKRITLKVGKSTTVSAKQTKLKKSRRYLTTAHANYFRYRSTDPSIAKVNSKGKVTAKAKGKCRICIQAQNGLADFITIKVK